MPAVSVVSPAFNESANINTHIARVLHVFDTHHIHGELIIVDDASTDDTQHILRNAMQDARVRVFRLKQNSNRAGATAVGMAKAKGETIVMMDSDLQNDANSIPLLLQAIEDGADVVLGWRQHRQDSLQKIVVSRFGNAAANVLFGTRFHDMNSSLKAIRAHTIQNLSIARCFRFLPHVIAQKNYTVKEIPVPHYPRQHGQSKFGLWNRLHTIADLVKIRFNPHQQSRLPEYYPL